MPEIDLDPGEHSSSYEVKPMSRWWLTIPVALILIGAAWLIVPVIALSDRIAFDGAFLRRQGPLASLLHLLFGYRKQLAIDDFETVETQAVRTLRRGGRVRLRPPRSRPTSP